MFVFSLDHYDLNQKRKFESCNVTSIHDIARPYNFSHFGSVQVVCAKIMLV